MNKKEYLIIGAGPTGLGAATRLHEKQLDWHLLEKENQFGGLASTFIDPKGFSWDCGGHVQFSHYDTFDRYMDLALGQDGWLTHQRESWVWIRKRFVPYPFQNNLHRLDLEDRQTCVNGLRAAHQKQIENRQSKIDNFEEWMLATFGDGITDLFLRPYNYKVWAYPPSAMDYSWIGERVAVPDLDAVLKSIKTGEDQVSWGPNRVFRFPKKGGTGAVWNAIGNMLPTDRISLNSSVAAIDVERKIVRCQNGEVWKYRHLISTIPLNHLIRSASGVVNPEVAKSLRYSSTHVVGVGMEGQAPEHLNTKCWMYFPESNSPYYRVTVFSNYSANNVARPGQQWSLMTETSESPHKPVQLERLEEETVRALEEDGLLPDRSKVCSVAHYHLPQGYPTPFGKRDSVVDPILRAFEQKNIYSRGRFGAWKYEVANQDHSFAQGYECAERLSQQGGPELEPTLFTPHLVNARRNT